MIIFSTVEYLQYGPAGRFTKNLKIAIHTWNIFILLEKHHQCHCKPTNYRYDYV